MNIFNRLIGLIASLDIRDNSAWCIFLHGGHGLPFFTILRGSRARPRSWFRTGTWTRTWLGMFSLLFLLVLLWFLFWNFLSLFFIFLFLAWGERNVYSSKSDCIDISIEREVLGFYRVAWRFMAQAAICMLTLRTTFSRLRFITSPLWSLGASIRSYGL